MEFKETDIRIDSFRTGVVGGMSTGTLQAAVRITHIPTGLTVDCSTERSQHKNKKIALELLRKKVEEHDE